MAYIPNLLFQKAATLSAAGHLRKLLRGHTVFPLVTHGYPSPSGLSRILQSARMSGLGEIIGYLKPANHENADAFFYQHYDDHASMVEEQYSYQQSLIVVKTPNCPFYRIVSVCVNDFECKLVLMVGLGYKNTCVMGHAETYLDDREVTPTVKGKRRSIKRRFRSRRAIDYRPFYSIYCGKYASKSIKDFAELSCKYDGLLNLRMVIPYNQSQSIIRPKINVAEFDSTIEYHLRRILPAISEPWRDPHKILRSYENSDSFGFDLRTNKWKCLQDSFLQTAKVVD